ncbi:MAG: 23S rRNA (uracil(1939)-C(5))-methyltransferase RlmD [Steroidobacteraceae bacterium]
MSRHKHAMKLLPPQILDVVDLSHEAQGIARLEGRAVFIDGALPGETVEVQLLQRRKGVQEARLVQIIKPSPDRVEPRCRHYSLCGGCAEQHLATDKQLAVKQTQLLENMARIGKVEVPVVLPPLQADVWNYRRRARLGARWVPQKNRTLVGFRERSNSKLADIRRCEVLREPLSSLIEPLSLLLGSLSVRDRVPQVEAAVADNITALVIRILDDLTEADRIALHAFRVQHGVQIYLQREGYDSIAPLHPDSVQPLIYTLPQFKLEFEFLPNDFIQVNGALNQQMVALALQLLAVNSQDVVLDLFCGLGNFSLPLAQQAAQVLGIEGEATLVERARDNARRNGLSNVEFMMANLFEEHKDSPFAKRRFNKVLLDPPRAGAREILPVIANCGAKCDAQRVVYISCHPGSLARDAGILVHELGYTLKSAGVLDMFPHTAHVESVAVFERN